MTPSLKKEIKRLAPTSSRVFLRGEPGTGGDEASIWAGDLVRLYSKYAETQNWKVSLLSESPADMGGFKEAILEIKGDNVYSKLKFEAGVHRVQRVPLTEASGRVHTSTATVAIMPEVDDVEVHIDPKDIELTTARSGGAGTSAATGPSRRAAGRPPCAAAVPESSRTRAATAAPARTKATRRRA